MLVLKYYVGLHHIFLNSEEPEQGPTIRPKSVSEASPYEGPNNKDFIEIYYFQILRTTHYSLLVYIMKISMYIVFLTTCTVKKLKKIYYIPKK